MTERISAVLITKNEQKVIGRCLKSVAGVDEIIVLDTGSTDGTVKIAREGGATVQEAEPIVPFHFATARNMAHDLASNDWILTIDADEILRAGMIRKIRTAIREEEAKEPFERASAFLVTFTDRGAITHKKKVYRKGCWNWKWRVHEQLLPTGTDVKEAMLKAVVMEHLPVPDKTLRHGQNVELLKMVVVETPEYTRAWKYLGQELMQDKAYRDALPYLAHFVEHSTDGPLETSEGMMRVGQCYAELKDYDTAIRWFEMAATTDPRRREPLFHAGRYLMLKSQITYGDLVDATNFLRRCVSIPISSKPGGHTDHAGVWGHEPERMLAFLQEEVAKARPSKKAELSQ